MLLFFQSLTTWSIKDLTVDFTQAVSFGSYLSPNNNNNNNKKIVESHYTPHTPQTSSPLGISFRLVMALEKQDNLLVKKKLKH